MLARIKEIWEGDRWARRRRAPPTPARRRRGRRLFRPGRQLRRRLDRRRRRRPSNSPRWRGRSRAAWTAAGREGEPRLAGLAYFSLGERRRGRTRNAYLGDYYAWLGEEVASYIAACAAKDAETVRKDLAAFEGAGCDELILFPSSSDPAQVDLLADAAGL